MTDPLKIQAPTLIRYMLQLSVLQQIKYFNVQYLACLSSSSSNDKLAFDVGLQEQSEGKQTLVAFIKPNNY